MNDKGLHFETNLVMNPVKGVSLFQKQNNAKVVMFTNFHVSKMLKKRKNRKKMIKNFFYLIKILFHTGLSYYI